MLMPDNVLSGKYRILGMLGRGGISRVYLAEDIGTGRRYAVKEIPDRYASEIEMLSKLRHSGLPQIYDAVWQQEILWLVIEYIPGSSLRSLLDEYGAQPLESSLDWMIQLCEVLTYLHTRTPPIIYRDVKPGNIILKPDGRIMLIDFGAAREYKPGGDEDTELLGTRGYAAPEQYGGFGQTDARTDIYGVGATLYHIISGHNPAKPPYKRLPVTELNPCIPYSLERLIDRCTRSDAEERYKSCGVLLGELRKIKRCVSQSAVSGFTEVIGTCKPVFVVETDITIVATRKIMNELGQIK